MAEIEHKGVITAIDGNKISVRIVSSSACGACHAKGVCGASESTEKIVTAACANPSEYNVSDEVTLCISTSTGIIVVILAYILPVIVILALLVGLNQTGVSDAVSASVALVSVVLYFFVLFLFKNKINKKIKINIK